MITKIFQLGKEKYNKVYFFINFINLPSESFSSLLEDDKYPFFGLFIYAAEISAA
jgi:hypothetical protein